MDSEGGLRARAPSTRPGQGDTRCRYRLGCFARRGDHALVEAAALKLDDYFEFDIQRVGEVDVGGAGGVRFHADAYVGGRLFEPLLIDVGVGSEALTQVDELTAPDLLDFAEIEPARVRAISLEQHIAEKLHAYTRRHADDQRSSRVKDLIDIILMSELADFDFDRLRGAVVSVFEARATHKLPASLPAPPREWARPYRVLAEEVGLDPDSLAGHRLAAGFLDPVRALQPGLNRWSTEALRWKVTLTSG